MLCISVFGSAVSNLRLILSSEFSFQICIFYLHKFLLILFYVFHFPSHYDCFPLNNLCNYNCSFNACILTSLYLQFIGLFLMTFLLIIGYFSLFLNISLISGLFLSIVDSTLSCVLCCLSLKCLGFVLTGNWITVQFDPSEDLLLRYFREILEWLYSRNSLALLLRPGPSVVFTEWLKVSMKTIHSWNMYNS